MAEEKDKKPDASVASEVKKPEVSDADKKEPEVKTEAAKEPEKKEEHKEEVKTEAGTEDKKEEKKEEVVDSKPQETAKEEEKKETTAEEAPKENAGEEVKSEEEKKDDAVKPEKKKGFRLPFFGKKNKDDENLETGEALTTEQSETAGKEGALEASEDEALTAIEKVQENLAEKINDDVEYMSDVLVIRISKSRLMLVLGLLVLAMWMIPAVRGVELLMKNMGLSLPQKQEQTEEADVVKVKIKHSPDQDGISDELSGLLRDGGYDFIEIEEDGEASFEGVAVVTKNTDIETRIKIEGLLMQKYKVASPSAELTEDSDFDAVIIIGKQETAK